jgi:hypothetical protein
MAPKPLEVLKNGLVKFTEAIKTRKTKHNEKLAWAETISSSDEHWLDYLDNKGNTVDMLTSNLNVFLPIARKFETFLSSFSRLLRLEETKSMKETVLTDFFQRS